MEHFSLKESVQTVKELLPLLLEGDFSPHQAAQVYLASLHLLCEVKKDQVLLERIRYESCNDDWEIVFIALFLNQFHLL
jgi:hypothetical protein